MRRLLRPVLWPAARWLTRRGIRILMYHRFGPRGAFRRVDPAGFDRQLSYIRRHFVPGRLSEVVARLRSGLPVEPGTAVVTVDDGYADFAEYAYPLLERHRVPVTVFLVSEFIERRIWLWFDAIHHLVHATTIDRAVLELPAGRLELDLSTIEARNASWERVADACLLLSSRCRAEVLARLERAVGVRLPGTATGPYAPLTWDQIRAMDARLVEYGAQTRTHPILSHCSDQELRDEIAGSKAHLEARLGRAVPCFCYPNGRAQDYDDRAVAAVRDAGFAAAVTAEGALVWSDTDIYRLPRLPTSSDEGHFRSAVNGLDGLRLRILGGS
jgi:peptidoglycan/xylan/chitin deacetylase (PgdA/CDA1 family)